MHRVMPRQRVGDFLCFAHDATLQCRRNSAKQIPTRGLGRLLIHPYGMNRLIRKEDLPESLWQHSDRVLKLPPDLIRAWLALLDRHDLRMLATQNHGTGGCIGGLSKEATNKHFAWRFSGSSARVQLAMLDPESHMPNVADAFAQLFSGGHVALCDLPCGSGAAALTILTVLAELRRQGRVPREPLDVTLIGGEISADARGYAAEGLSEIQAALEAQAISVRPAFLSWDVCNAISNTDLIRQLTIRCNDCASRMLVLANFSGFLQREGKWDDAQPQLDELFRHSRDQRSSVVWIEPQMNDVLPETGGMFRRVTNWLSSLTRFVRQTTVDVQGGAVARSELKVAHVLRPGETFDVSLAVMRFDLNL